MLLFISGQYGIDGVFVGVPTKLGAGGIEEILELKLTDKESADLKASAESVRTNVSKMNELISAAA